MSQFYFAWVDSTESTFGPEHARYDETIFQFEIEHVEGDFAVLHAAVQNPRIGLLAPARKTWAWLSWDNGHGPQPLFFGRLVGVPSDIQAEVVQLDFVARPVNYVAQKAALATALRILPYYDPVFVAVDQRADDDVVLEGYSRFWHIDRVTHVLSTSDVLSGEDGLDVFQKSDVPYDSVKVTLQQAPLRTITVTANVGWTQRASGNVQSYNNARIDSFTGDGLIDDWPKFGANLGGGWTAGPGCSIVEIPFSVEQFYTPPQGAGRRRTISGTVADLADDFFSGSAPDDFFNNAEKPVPDGWLFITTIDILTVLARFHEGLVVPLWRLRASLDLQYGLERGRTEQLTFTLATNVQPIVTLPGQDEIALLDISGNALDEPADGVAADQLPIQDVRRNEYFSTSRGRSSIEYLIHRARAQLMLRSRAVQIEFECRMERAAELSCRKSAELFDHRLPGGSAVGKIIGYAISGNGDTGQLIGRVTMGCPIGYGGAITEIEGDPVYGSTDYMGNDYQRFEGSVQVLGTGDIGYTVPAIVNSDGASFDLTQGALGAAAFISAPTVHNDATSQVAPIVAAGQDAEAVKAALKLIPTTVDFTLINVTNGPFDNLYDITVTDLEIPAGVNLEAAS